ncbi:VOC family protein [Hwanghaeella sp.]|uniref:VOC family protein n=1 Tax=Hwanghaeella sp. TaxID=2605943 RepID=UPI003CCBD426
MDAPIRFLSLDHLVIRCADLERMQRFYGDVLGCPLERALEEQGLYQYRAGAALIDLVDIEKPIGKGASPDPKRRNMAHFCLRIEDADWDTLVAYFRDNGIDIDDAPSRRYGADGQGQSVYLRDPEGNEVELKMSPEPGSLIG